MFGAHHAVSATVVLTQDNRDFRNGAFAVSVQQFGAVQDDAAVLLSCAGQEAGNVNEGDNRNVEGVAEADETGAFSGSVDVQHTGQIFGLVGHNTHGDTVETGETDDDIGGIVGLYFEEFAIIDNAVDDFLYIVRLVGVVGDDGVQSVVQAVDRIFAGNVRRLFHVVGRQVRHQFAQQGDTFLFGVNGEMGHT